MPDNLAQLTEEEIWETSMVDFAFHILQEKGEPMLYREIMQKIAKLKGFSEEEINQLIAQLYTEINIDGRFICVGKSLWGLKRWYPIEQATDSAVAQNVKEDESEEESKEEDGETDFDEDFEEEGYGEEEGS